MNVCDAAWERAWAERTHIQMQTNCLTSSHSSAVGHVLPVSSLIVACSPLHSP